MASASDPRRSGESRETASAAPATKPANQPAEAGRAAIERGTDAAANAARGSSTAAVQFASQERNAAETGVRQMAEATSPAADASFNEGRRLIEASVRITDLYREASDDTAEDVQALTTSYAQLGQGLLRMQHAYFDVLHQALNRARRQPQDLLRCRSFADFAEVQRDLYKDGVAFMLESSTTLMRLAGEVVQVAARPLETRAQVRE
jgi:prophage DNA circulation protein